jgi:hypothetical protein
VELFEDEINCMFLGSFCVDWLRDANLLELDATNLIDNKNYILLKNDGIGIGKNYL